jgi:hypothetical protein
VTFLATLVIKFTILFIPTASFLAKIGLVVRIIVDMTRFRALMAAIETTFTRPRTASCFRVVTAGDFNFVTTIG